MFAATYPERVRALVLYGAYASGSMDDDGSPGRDKWIRLGNQIRESIDHWGEGRSVDWAAPSLSSNFVYRSAVGALERAAMSPSMALLTFQGNLTHFHVRDVLGSVHVPTLVVHRKGEAIPIEYAREVAAGIPSARIVELEGVDHWPTVATSSRSPAKSRNSSPGTGRRTYPTGCWPCCSPTSSIRRGMPPGSGTALGASYSRATTNRPHRNQPLPRASRTTHQRRFSRDIRWPTRALRCATTVAERMPELGIDVRCGRHTGECEIRGDDIGGIAVHIGARVAALAQAGEVLVSSTVKDLVNGSGIAFTERGSHMLKGVPGQWQLFAPAGQVAAVDYHVPVKRRGFQAFMADRISRRPRIARTVLRMSYRR